MSHLADDSCSVILLAEQGEEGAQWKKGLKGQFPSTDRDKLVPSVLLSG